MMHLYVYFREQKGGPVNPASSKYSSPSKVNAPAEPVGQEKAGGECKLMSGRGLIRATPVGLLLPFAFTSLDKAVSLSLQFSIPSRYKLFSCLDFFLAVSQLSETMLSLLLPAATELFCLLF